MAIAKFLVQTHFLEDYFLKVEPPRPSSSSPGFSVVDAEFEDEPFPEPSQVDTPRSTIGILTRYAADPVYKDAAHFALKFCSRYLAGDGGVDRILPSYTYATSGGAKGPSIMLAFDRASHHLDLEFCESGRIEWFYVDKNFDLAGEERGFESSIDACPTILLERLRLFQPPPPSPEAEAEFRKVKESSAGFWKKMRNSYAVHTELSDAERRLLDAIARMRAAEDLAQGLDGLDADEIRVGASDRLAKAAVEWHREVWPSPADEEERALERELIAHLGGSDSEILERVRAWAVARCRRR